MPERNVYLSVDRLAALIRILSYEWEDAGALMAQLEYPENDESAKRAFRRDIAALRALGFQVDRSLDKHKPAYRLLGHVKWPRAAAIENAIRYNPPTGPMRQG